MRNWHWLIGVSVASSVAGFVACGGSSDDNSGGSDAGADVGTKDSAPAADTGPADAGTPPVDASVPCVFPDAALDTLNVPDAAINDAGASLGRCISCSRTKCGAETTACSGDCVCSNVIIDFYACLGSATAFQTCAAPLIGVIQSSPTTQALGTCVLGGCSSECGIPSFGGTDSGTDAAKDAATDTGASDAKTD